MLDEIKDVFEKINRDRYIIGFDLNEYYAQVSYMRIDSNSPETVSSVMGEEEFNIPIAVCRVNGRFYVGKEAIEQSAFGGSLVTDFVEDARADKTVSIDGQNYSCRDLLLLFIQKSLFITPLMTTPEKIAGVAITVRYADAEMIGILKKLPELIKLNPDKVTFVNYEEAFHYYMAFQPGELQNHNILLCDGTGDYLKTYRLERNKFSQPVAVMVHRNEYEEVTFDGDSSMDEAFLRIAKRLCDNRVFSGVYLIGEGFFGEWCRESLKYLCKGRRVFKGNNLFSKGACLAGRERIAPSGIDNKVRYLGETNVKVEIGIRVTRLGVINNVTLVKPGEQWFEVDSSCEVLLRGTNEIELYIKPLGNSSEKVAAFKLDDMSMVNGRMTRVLVSASMPAENRVEFKVRDLGFGEIFPNTGLEWVEEMELV